MEYPQTLPLCLILQDEAILNPPVEMPEPAALPETDRPPETAVLDETATVPTATPAARETDFAIAAAFVMWRAMHGGC